MLTLNVTRRRLRLLQGVALVFSAVGMTVFVSNGAPPFAVLVGGVGFGLLSFLPVAVVLLLYWAASPSPSKTTSEKAT